MSYILDALRKSEQDRRDQETPTSFSGVTVTMGASEETSNRTHLWIIVGVLITVNILGLAYFFTRGESSGLEGKTVELSSIENGESIEIQRSLKSDSNTMKGVSNQDKPVNVTHELNGVSNSRAEVAVESVPDISVDPNPSIPEKYRIQKASKASGTESIAPNRSVSRDYALSDPLNEMYEGEVIRPRTGLHNQTIQPENTASTFENNTKKSMTQQLNEINAEDAAPKFPLVNVSSSKDVEGSVRAQLLEGLTPEPVEVIKPTVLSNLQSKGHSQAEANKLPVIKELSVNLQKKVPPIQFSGHLYSSRSSSRSVRLGENKYREGDWINDTLKLTSITEDGVVFEISNTQFYMSSFEDWPGFGK